MARHLTDAQAAEFGRLTLLYLEQKADEAAELGLSADEHFNWTDTDSDLIEVLQKVVGEAPMDESGTLHGEEVPPPTMITQCKCGQKNRVKIGSVARCGNCKQPLRTLP